MERAELAAEAAAVDEKELISLLQQMIRLRSYSAGGEEGRIAASWPTTAGRWA